MKIVIGYDGSDSVNSTLKDLWSAGLPRKCEVLLVHAVPPLLPLANYALAGAEMSWYAQAYKMAVEGEKAALEKSKRACKEAAKFLKGMFPSWKVAVEASVDFPAHAILFAAEKVGADLVVVGSKGWNTFSKVLLGSVADKVLNHAHCTVRLGKPRSQGKPRPPRILIGYDGSKHADEAVRQVALRVWPKGTEVRVVAASEFQLRMGDIAMVLNRTLEARDGRKSPWPWMGNKLAKAVHSLEQAGLQAHSKLVIGDARRTLLSQARRFKADTLVLGTHGHTGMARFMLGSVSASVAAHAPCTVEVARAPFSPGGKKASVARGTK